MVIYIKSFYFRDNTKVFVNKWYLRFLQKNPVARKGV